MMLDLLRSLSRLTDRLSKADDNPDIGASRLGFADWIAMVGAG